MNLFINHPLKRLAIPFCGCMILVGTFACMLTRCQSDTAAPKAQNDAVIHELSDRLLRFRVLANSDSEADQRQKNKVSAGLAALLRPLLSGCTSKEEALSRLNNALPLLEETAAGLSSEYGDAYPVSCTLAAHQFPLKVYQDLTFPAGEYDTLLVTIGDGAGSNWWCLAYPPLCFAEEAYVTVPEEADETLRCLLSEETYSAISEQEKAVQKRNEKKPVFYFRLLPFLNRLTSDSSQDF